MTPVAIAMYVVHHIALYVAAVCIAALGALAATGTALVIVAAGPQFALGVTLVFGAGFGFGILTMYAYVSSLGWERRGLPSTRQTTGDPQ